MNDKPDAMQDKKTIPDILFDFAVKYPKITTGIILTASAFVCYKAIELPIKNAIVKANKETIRYLAKEMRYAIR